MREVDVAGRQSTSDERDEVPSTSVAEADALAGELKAKVQISRRRPDFTLPPLHKDLHLSSHAPLETASSEGGSGRVFCRSCKSSRRFFCHVCLDAYTERPTVRLPCRAYFITDRNFDPTAIHEVSVDAVAVDGDGNVVVGGTFGRVNGVSSNNIARLNSDGSTDSFFDPGSGFDGPVLAIAIDSENRIVVGGAFSTYKGEAASGLVRLFPDGTRDPAIGADDIALLTERLHDSGSIERVRDRARFHARAAAGELERLPDNPARRALQGLPNLLLHRSR